MSYTKTVWQAHDIITAEKMQKIENQLETLSSSSASFAPTIANPQDGQTLVYNAQQQKWVNGAASGSSSGLVIQVTSDADENLIFNKTAAEVLAALSAGKYVIVHFPDFDGYSYNQYGTIMGFGSASENGQFSINVIFINDNLTFECDTLNDYPTYGTKVDPGSVTPKPAEEIPSIGEG